jgi:hypothetical protein
MKRPYLLAAAFVVSCVAVGAAQLRETFFDALNDPAIEYGRRPTSDPVSALERRLSAGDSSLKYETTSGYLRSLLAALDVPIESQMVVYSKTSLQSPRITPDNPRAIYFNDTVAVAWPRGGFIEMAAADARQGVSFYMLDQQSGRPPAIVRPSACLSCHHSYATGGVPGPLIRSVVTGPDGRILPWLGNYTTTHASPFGERWGGWYVTGRSEALGHLGNSFVTAGQNEASPAPAMIPEQLDRRFPADVYPSRYSDIVALLVFDHQMPMLSLLTRVGWDVRLAAADGGDPARVAADDAVEFVDYLLFVDEAPLPGRIRGTSGFAERFQSQGPHDRRGRSLRELDLDRRLMRYPCSYMIYAPLFDALPDEARTAIYRRLWRVLSGAERASKYQRLSLSDRRAIVEILRDTKKDLPAYFESPAQ